MVLLGQIFAGKIWVIGWKVEGGRRKGEEGESFHKINNFCVVKNWQTIPNINQRRLMMMMKMRKNGDDDDENEKEDGDDDEQDCVHWAPILAFTMATRAE